MPVKGIEQEPDSLSAPIFGREFLGFCLKRNDLGGNRFGLLSCYVDKYVWRRDA